MKMDCEVLQRDWEKTEKQMGALTCPELPFRCVVRKFEVDWVGKDRKGGSGGWGSLGGFQVRSLTCNSKIQPSFEVRLWFFPLISFVTRSHVVT